MIGIYNGAVQSGDQSGTLVSDDNKITMVLNSSQNQEDTQTIAIRATEAQYQTVGDVEISLVGTTASKWALSEDNSSWGEWGAKLTLTSPNIGNKNKLLYIKAKATEDEGAKNDISVNLRVSCTVGTI